MFVDLSRDKALTNLFPLFKSNVIEVLSSQEGKEDIDWK